MRSALISDAYQEQQRIMHEAGPYGTASISYAPIVSEVINRMEVLHLLDYGCGAACNLSKHLKVNHKLTYQAYDPGVERFSKPPAPAEMVACIDVLEHIEPDKLDVINSLVMDASVLNSSSFEDWADEFGYDRDSRKAETIYRACLDIALKLRNAIGESKDSAP